MTPLFPTPDHYLYNLITMTAPEAKRLWRRAIKEHFDCTCAYCGETYDINELTLDHVKPRSSGGEDLASNLLPACRRCNQDKGSKHWQTFIRQQIGYYPIREHLIKNHIQ